MKKVKIVTSFSRLSESKFFQKAQMILQCMTNNANFPTPSPDLTTLGEAITAYAAALANPLSQANTALKNQLRAALTALLNQLALYVEINGNNDETVLLSSGFSLRKPKQPVGILPQASNFKATPLHNCMIKLSNQKIDGADSYCYDYTPVPVTEASTWTSINSTKASTLISNLTSGSQYAFRVSGIGSNPTVVYSNVITSYVL